MKRSIIARFMAGVSPAMLAKERCDRLHGRRPYWTGCNDCLLAIYEAIRRDHRKALKRAMKHAGEPRKEK